MSLEIVKTAQGLVRGAPAADPRCAGLTYFNSIPYAAPPVGELRWRPPQDPAPWQGVRDCTGFACRPVQVCAGPTPEFEPYSQDFCYEPFPPMSEDCLYLRVVTPAAEPGEKLPVFVWFHGGGLSSGYYFEPEFEPSLLAKKGVVVVSVGHRLTIMGYLSLPQLSAEQGGVSGNYGLMDTVKAVEWVHDNIAAFGGDPDNVTVGGQSGGCSKSSALSFVPQLRGKLRRVIQQSAMPWPSFGFGGGNIPTVAQAEEKGRKLLELAGVDPDLPLSELRAIPAEKLIVTFYGDISMVQDGKYILYPTGWENQAAMSRDRDYLLGINYGEVSFTEDFGLGVLPKPSAAKVRQKAREILGELYDEYQFERLIPLTEESADHVARRLCAEGLSKILNGGLMRDRYFGAYQARNGGGRVFSYIFSRVSPCKPEEVGGRRDSDRLLAFHSAELHYMFGGVGLDLPPARPWTDTDRTLSDQMTSYWANFMRSGDPNGEGLPHWPQADENFGYMELGDRVCGYAGLYGKREEMLLAYTRKTFGAMLPPELQV